MLTSKHINHNNAMVYMCGCGSFVRLLVRSGSNLVKNDRKNDLENDIDACPKAVSAITEEAGLKETNQASLYTY